MKKENFVQYYECRIDFIWHLSGTPRLAFPPIFPTRPFFFFFSFSVLSIRFSQPSLQLPLLTRQCQSRKVPRQNVNNSNNISLIRHSNEANETFVRRFGPVFVYALNIVGLRFGSLASHSFSGEPGTKTARDGTKINEPTKRQRCATRGPFRFGIGKNASKWNKFAWEMWFFLSLTAHPDEERKRNSDSHSFAYRTSLEDWGSIKDYGSWNGVVGITFGVGSDLVTFSNQIRRSNVNADNYNYTLSLSLCFKF